MMGETTGGVRLLLRAEALCVLVAAVLMYARSGFGWGTFALFFLAPDLSFFGYLAGAHVGAACYNAAHSYIGVVVCGIAGVTFASPVLMATALIWAAHIGFDRTLGYGLKYSAGFGYTHLGRIGRQHDARGPQPSSA
ncbi:DUF4260 domain-containing protein [Dokdonella soli]|uniref:DUF4260 domain-containing protein n=1 Tax=Dokdonella soli TaxID=529810 RepID=A0ABN1IK40_9GAMM